MNDEALEEMMSSMRKHTMKRLLELLDEATEAAYKGEVDEVRKATQEALFRIDMASEALFGLIANNYGADEAVLQKVEKATNVGDSLLWGQGLICFGVKAYFAPCLLPFGGSQV